MWILILVAIFLLYVIVVRPYLVAKRDLRVKLVEDIHKALQASMEKTSKENALLQSGRLPTDEEIKKYYKMYLKKLELNDCWMNEMKFDDFEKRAKTPTVFGASIDIPNGKKLQFGVSGGFNFLLEMTSDLFMMDGQCIRMTDYEGLVDEDEKKELTNETK